MNPSIRSIVHPTDFSDLSAAAFAHALRIALATRSKLHLVHVSQYDAHEALAFPHGDVAPAAPRRCTRRSGWNHVRTPCAHSAS